MPAIGGENVSTTIEGRNRYPINIRYPRELRESPLRIVTVRSVTSPLAEDDTPTIEGGPRRGLSPEICGKRSRLNFAARGRA